MNEATGESTVEETAETPPQESEVTPAPHTLGLELPADPGEAIALLLGEVKKSRQEAGAYLNDLKRVAADFENYRKRSLRDSATMLDRATEKVVIGLMPVLDSFDAALTSEPEGEADKQLLSGMTNTRDQLLKALENEGLETLPTVGEAFDPEIHEPVGAPGTGGAIVVTQELRRGYRLKGKVLRAALVVLDVK